MKAFLVGGGTVDTTFLKERYLSDNYDLVIGIDGGGEYLYKANIEPDVLLGDFDTLSTEIFEFYMNNGIKILKYNDEKDETDTELALMYAIENGCDELELYGATGTRLDHVLGNLQSLAIAYKHGIKSYIIDRNNRIHYVNRNECIKKKNQYGKYVSFVPMTQKVTALSLQGFKFPLDNVVLTNDKSLAISNQITEDEAFVQYKDGMLLMIESKD